MVMEGCAYAKNWQYWLPSGIEDPNLRAWSQGVVGDKSLQKVVGEFEELLIRRVRTRVRRSSRVAHHLAVLAEKGSTTVCIRTTGLVPKETIAGETGRREDRG